MFLMLCTCVQAGRNGLAVACLTAVREVLESWDKGMMTSYDSVSNCYLNSTGANMSSTGPGPKQPATIENLEQFEVRKQQKDIWENGIEM